MKGWESSASAGVTIARGRSGRVELVGDGYRRTTPYDASFLDLLGSARRGQAIVEDLLVSEEPDRLAGRLARLLGGRIPAGEILHWGAGSLALDVALLRLGFPRLAVAESNPLWHPIGRERLRQTGHLDRVRFVGESPADPRFDLLLLAGDPALRESLPDLADQGSALRRLRPGGTLVLLGWPRARPLHPAAARWPLLPGELRALVQLRLLWPRGGAPVPSAARRAAGRALAAASWGAPDLALRVLGERYEVRGRPDPGSL